MDHKTKLALWSAANSVMSSLEALLQYKQNIDQHEAEGEEHGQAMHLANEENEYIIINAANEPDDEVIDDDDNVAIYHDDDDDANDDDDVMDYISEDSIPTTNSINSEQMLETKKRKVEKKRNCWIKEFREERKIFTTNKELLEEYKLIGDAATPPIIDEMAFQELLDYIEPDIAKQDTFLRRCVSARERLGATLLFLMTGKSGKELSAFTKISASLLNGALVETCDVIYQRLKDKYMKLPTNEDEWKEIAKMFENLYKFPLCLGAIDAHHIAITPCRQNSPIFVNSEGYRSIILLTLTDANGRFLYADVGGYGSLNINEAFLRTDLYKMITTDNDKMPTEESVNNTRILPYVMIGDGNFPLLKNLMTPFSLERIHEQNLYFNNRLNAARTASLQAFKLMSKHFRILTKTSYVSSTKTAQIVLACCVLHNFLKEKCAWYTNIKDEQEDGNVLHNMIVERDVTKQEYSADDIGEIVRADFSNYFYYENLLT